MNSTIIVWLRQDLRLKDNPALFYASQDASHIVPVYILDNTLELGAASKAWLYYSLKSLDDSLKERGSKLLIRSGHPLEELEKLIQSTQANGLYWNRLYEPHAIKRDSEIKEKLKSKTNIQSFNAHLINEPWKILKKDQTPYKVFTPYYKACLQLPLTEPPLPEPKKISTPPKLESLTLEALQLKPKLKWDKNFWQLGSPGETLAQNKWKAFIKHNLNTYSLARNRPDLEGTSMLSPHLHFGEISVRQMRQDLLKIHAEGSTSYLRELYWREFAHHLLYYFPSSITKALKAEFETFPWQNNADHLMAWQKGLTGYPIVDAGMRELWQTGLMHNRVRMIVGSFLIKDLLFDWKQGAKWFWDTLVDADLANNTMGWQWVAGCGADAAPFFRIFNPTTQAEKFDPEGLYIRKYIPELAKLPNPWVFKPWLTPPDILSKAGVKLGSSYPNPIVDHATCRTRALDIFKNLKKPKG